MSLKLIDTACIAKGTFNIYIFRPPWVGTIMDNVDGDELAFEADFGKPGFRLRFPKMDLHWVIRPDAIVVTSPTTKLTCGDYIAKIVEALPVTPLEAVGNNFVFSAEEDLPQLGSKFANGWLKHASQVSNCSSSAVSVSLEDGGAVFNASLKCEEKGKLVAYVNVHRDTPDYESSLKAAQNFRNDFETVKKMLVEVFELEVCNDQAV
jgi:hypothetical protein